MTLAVNEFDRVYKKGVGILYDLKQLIVSFLIQNGANTTTSRIPRGIAPVCARVYKVTKPTIFNIWRKYCFNGSLDELPHHANGIHRRLLSQEDHDFIKQLLVLDPTLYKSEIRDKLYEYSNSPPASVSISTLSRTVRYRLGLLKWTRKRVQRSNKARWTDTNILYMRNFMDHISTISPYDIRFVNKCSFHCASGTRFYGSSEIGSRALHIAKHPVGPNYTLFLMIGLNNKIFAYVSEGNSDSYTYIEFIHQAVLINDINGEPVLYPGCCIVADRTPIHGRWALDVLDPYLDDLDIKHYFLSSHSPSCNPCEEFFAIIKNLMRTRQFQELLNFYVPTAIYESVTHVTPDVVYKLFRHVSCNYMNL